MATRMEPVRHVGIMSEFAEVSGEILILPAKELVGC